jgi:hypothetical protein
VGFTSQIAVGNQTQIQPQFPEQIQMEMPSKFTGKLLVKILARI